MSLELPKGNPFPSGGTRGQISFKILKELVIDAYDHFLKDLKGNLLSVPPEWERIAFGEL